MSKLTQAWAQRVSPRAHIWADVPDQKWNDWRWQLSHRVRDLELLETFINLTGEEIEGISADGKFRLDITPCGSTSTSTIPAKSPRNCIAPATS